MIVPIRYAVSSELAAQKLCQKGFDKFITHCVMNHQAVCVPIKLA